MMKKAIVLAATLGLSATLMAGGDDRDTGPVEPIFDKVVVNEKAPESMTLSQDKVIGSTVSGVPVTQAAHNACAHTLNLSESNIARFKDALAGGFLYNTGPLDELGTEFSPLRWADYFNCVENY